MSLTLTAAQADTLRFVLGIIDVEDLESTEDQSNFLAILDMLNT